MTYITNTQSYLVINADGSCSGNPGPGGYAATIRRMDVDNRELKFKKLFGNDHATTNVRMEMTAVAVALEFLKGNNTSPIVVRTDSQTIVQGMTEWITTWISRGWRTSAGKPVANQDLWQRILGAAKHKVITWEWVKGHAGDPYNEEVDRIAAQQTAKAKREA